MRQKEAEIVTPAFIARKDTYNLTCGGKGGFYYINNVLRKDVAWEEEKRRKKIRLSQHRYQQSRIYHSKQEKNYYLNPSFCLECQRLLDYKKILQGNTFCSRHCSAVYNNRERYKDIPRRKRINNRLQKRLKYNNNPKKCLYCQQIIVYERRKYSYCNKRHASLHQHQKSRSI